MGAFTYKKGHPMKYVLTALLLAGAVAHPAFAALKAGDMAPTFDAKASQAGKTFEFSLRKALRKGPVVVYFYPAAYTKGCDVEAHTFAEMKDKFDAAGATIIGVSNDNIARLNQFSADPDYCAGKFPVASDPDGKIATSYDLKVTPPKEGLKDTQGVTLDHAFTERTTFVITRNDKVFATLSSADDKISPADHVDKSLAVVQQLTGKGQ
jgi:peroxiredoxin Q/BCP